MNPQDLFDAALVVPTVPRPSLLRAMRSILAQDTAGRVESRTASPPVSGA